MRLVAISGGVPPLLTVEGTVLVILTGLFYTITGAVLFLVLRPRFSGGGTGRGFTFGLVILVAFGPAFFIADQAGELGVSPSVGIAVFSLLFIAGGTFIGWCTQAVERCLRPGDDRRTRVLGVLGWVVVVGSAPAVLGTYVLAIGRIIEWVAR